MDGSMSGFSVLHDLPKFAQFVVIHTVKGFSAMKQKSMVFWNSFYFSMIQWQFDLWFLCLFKSNLYIWHFLVHILLKPSLKNLEHYLASMWNEHNCILVWTFFVIAHCHWNENWPIQVLWSLMNFPNLPTNWVQHFNSSIFRIWNSSAGILSSPLISSRIIYNYILIYIFS